MIKRALFLSALFIFLLPVSVSACKIGKTNEQVTVKFVYDGDTLYLKDGRKVRVLGIDTPEMRNRKRQQPAEAFSAEATEALRGLLSKHRNKVELQIGTDAYDRYGRVLAHVFLKNGTNISQWMLKKGFATTLFIPPNLEYLECYTKAEASAQRKQKNIWKLPQYNLQIADLLDKNHKGYIRLLGRVKRVKKNKRSIRIDLRGGIRVNIASSNIRYFGNINFDKLEGKRVKVTGILKKKGRFRSIHVKHPTYFSVL